MLSEEEKAIQFYKRFIEVEEQELEWMYKEDEEYYRDSIEQKELLIKGWRNILNLITKLQKENNELKNKEKRTIIFIDSQIRCFDRKIKNILSIKKERCLSERERREIKYLVGKKDECEKIKSKINKFKEN